MPEVAFVMSDRQPYRLRELAATLGHELGSQAVPSSLHIGGFPAHRQSIVYVLLDPWTYVADEGEDALPGNQILRRTIFVCIEAPPQATEDEYVALLRRAGAVFVLDRRAAATMHRLGIPARLIRPGYAKSLDRFDPAAPRPIDVLFLGANSLRRTKYLNRAARVLSRHNSVLRLSEQTPTAGDTSAPLAEARWPLLTQAKVVISIQRDENSHFDWDGAVDAIHAGAVVVTESAGGMAPLIPGQHLVATGVDSLPYIVEDLLGDEERLALLRSGAHERLKAWAPYALSVALLRAAVVELVGEPVESGPALGRPHRPPAAADTPVKRDAHDHASHAELWSHEPTRIELVYESPAWGSRRAPRVSVVTMLSGRHEEVVATLESLTHSSMRDFELLLIDRSDSEQTRQNAADWIVAHPAIASRLVAADVTGAGPAWNIGVGLARGAFILILAPGQELYPRCLNVLAGTMEASPEVAFAFSIQEVTGAVEEFVQDGGDYLLNYLDWDPERVRIRNDIHIPALIRTDRLLRLGGFATDSRAVGFEDHDLWRRIADKGWRGQLVPQPLTRRPESGASPALPVSHP